MAEYSTRDRSKLFKSGLVDTADIKDSSVTVSKLGSDVIADYALKSYVDTSVSNLIDSAPGVLDTLNELAAAIGDDPDFITTVTTSIGTKLNSADFDSTFDTRLALKDTDDLTEGTNLYYTDARVQSKLANVSGHIIPDTNITYDLGSATNRFRDLYLSGNTINLGGTSITTDGSSVIVTDPDGDLLNISVQSVTVDGKELSSADILDFNLTIAPEVLEIQVDSTEPGDDVRWFWTWLQSTLPYARATITNSPQLTVPLYKKGTYTLNNFAAYETHDNLTQVHPGYLKWIDGAGTDNLVSWATYVQTTHSHPDINGGATTQVQRYTILVPEVVTPPTLNLPQGVGYDVSFATAGSYTFGAVMAHNSVASSASGNNPNIGPLYRGATYTFHLDASIENHPFYLTTDNGQGFVSGGYVGEYTTGVVGSRNNGSTGQETLTFTVPADAPDTLYYQCGVHGSMRGVITVKNLAVETNANGNYVLYFQHTHEGHKTPIEIRPIPSLVNQMCLVYDASSGRFVPQDLATYVENTPSFKLKIQEVAGTATLVAPDGTSLVASVKIFSDASYLPFSGNVAGDIAYTEDSNTLFIWNETQYNWVSTKVQNTDELQEGSTNKYYTDARAQAAITVDATLSKTGGEIGMPASGVTAGSYGSASTVPVISVDAQGRITSATTTNVAGVSGFSYTAATNTYTITTSAGTSFDATGDLSSFDTGDLVEGVNLYWTTARGESMFDTRLATKSTTDLAEGTNLYYTDARFDTRLATKSTTDLAEGTNLYFTTARAQNAISTSGSILTYSSGVVGLTAEAIQDVIGAMVSSNTESAISVTYNDAGNVLDFAVDTTTIATRTYVDNAIATVIDSAPAALDTLNELAAAINDDANYAATVTTALSNKADKSIIVTAGTGLTGGGTLANDFTISHADTSSQVSVDNSGNTFIQDITLDGFGHITSIASGTVTVGDGAMTVTAGTGLAGGGQLGTANQSTASSVTLSLATSGVTAGSYGSSTAIPVLTVDAYGRITAASTTAITVGNATLTVSAGAGLTGSGTFTANATTNNTITLSHADTSSVANLTAATNTFVTGLTFDTYGHVQTVTTGSPSGYLTTTGKAADSELLDGVDSSRYIYGSDQMGGRSTSTFAENPSRMGFFNVNGASNEIPAAGNGYWQGLDFRHDNTSNTWGWQLAGTYQSGYQDLYHRQVYAGSRSAWVKLWDSANDGSGSGLDADLLDGQHGSYYASASSLSNYLPLTGGTLSNGDNVTLELRPNDAGQAYLKVGRSLNGSQGTGIIEVTQDGGYGGGFYYNGDGAPTFISGESADTITFYRMSNGAKSRVFQYGYSSDTVTFTATPTVNGTPVSLNNHVHTNYTSYTESTTAPSSPNNGDEWYDTAEDILYKRTTGVWVQQQPSSGFAIFDVNGTRVN